MTMSRSSGHLRQVHRSPGAGPEPALGYSSGDLEQVERQPGVDPPVTGGTSPASNPTDCQSSVTGGDESCSSYARRLHAVHRAVGPAEGGI